MRNTQKKVEKIDGAIYNSNISILTEIENQSKLFGNIFDFGNLNFKNEDEIVSSYSHSFDSFYNVNILKDNMLYNLKEWFFLDSLIIMKTLELWNR